MKADEIRRRSGSGKTLSIGARLATILSTLIVESSRKTNSVTMADKVWVKLC